jgi:hypothetical protein
MTDAPFTEAHVHDCTGPGMRCPCGFVFQVARFYVSVRIHDNDSRETVAIISRNYESADDLARELRAAAKRIEETP